MAAAYSNQVPTSPTDLLQRLVTWLVAQGWTNNMSQADGSGWRAHLSKSGTYINLRALMTGDGNIWPGGMYFGQAPGIGLYVGTGFSAGSAWNAQAGGPLGALQTWIVGVGSRLENGAMTGCHFFDDGSDNIVVVVERSSGVFTYFGWGPSLVKNGTWTGGAYFFAPWSSTEQGCTYGGVNGSDLTALSPGGSCGNDSYGGSNAFVRADVDSFTGKWLNERLTGTGNPSAGMTGKRMECPVFNTWGPPADLPSYGLGFQGRQTSAMNSQVNLLPIRWFVDRDAGGMSLIGDYPNIFCCNGFGNGFAAKSIYQIGAENYMVFPYFAVRKWA